MALNGHQLVCRTVLTQSRCEALPPWWLKSRRQASASADLSLDYFGIVFLRIYDGNDHDRISRLNRRTGSLRCFFAAERALELPVHFQKKTLFDRSSLSLWQS